MSRILCFQNTLYRLLRFACGKNPSSGTGFFYLRMAVNLQRDNIDETFRNIFVEERLDPSLLEGPLNAPQARNEAVHIP